MTNAMITSNCTGLIRAIGLLLHGIISAESVYSPLISTTSGRPAENRITSQHNFKISKLIAHAMGFDIFYFTRQLSVSIEAKWRNTR
jgi:hypothetical protein